MRHPDDVLLEDGEDCKRVPTRSFGIVLGDRLEERAVRWEGAAKSERWKGFAQNDSDAPHLR
jgi:hypothetical protein